jgi:4-amino-4-deoxychorismate lyase
VLINGVETDRIEAADRGLAFGDGLFETIAVRDGLPCLWQAHLDRLREGAERLRIPAPPPDLLRDECLRVSGGRPRGVLKVILTRGTGGRGYRPPEHPRPTRIVAAHPWPAHPPEWARTGVRVGLCRTPLGANPRLAGIKHLNRLEQVLARDEWDDPELAEGLMCDGHGRVIAGTMSNLFVVRGGRLLTPSIDACGIAGTVRALTIRLAPAHGLTPETAELTPAELAGADGLFLTNALIGVWPVRRLVEVAFDPSRLPWDLIEAVRRQAHHPHAEASS